MSWQLFDRIAAFFRQANIYRNENLLQDQSSIARISAGGFSKFSTSHSLIDQTNLQINRLERYKDFDQMDQVGEISASLDMYADEASLLDNDTHHSLQVKAGSLRVKNELEDFFYNTLNVDNVLRPMARYLCKYGDFPAEIVTAQNRNGIASIRHMHVYNFTRVETKHGDLVGFFYQNEFSSEPTFFHPWQVMHLRLTSFENIYVPYGSSILGGSRKHFKQLRLMEDAAIVYRLTRSPERRVFKIPVGNIPAKEVAQYMEMVARDFKKRKIYDPASGDVSEKWSPLIQEDDYWLPMRCLAGNTRIPLVNGTIKTLEELVKEYGHMDKEFYVYSYDGQSIVSTKAKACVSPKNQSMVRVTLDNGQSIESTLDHKFMALDNTWIEAKDLKLGIPLISLYVRQTNEPNIDHKVISVEFLSEKQDTYCLSIDDTKCFFVESGVLVHNSDGSGPSIETLPGAQNLDQIADIEYFKKKMVSALKIPFSRVGIGDSSDGDSQPLSKVAPEFAKAVQWVQREMITGLKKLAIVHLALRGFSSDEIRNFTLHMTASSAIDELYRIETWAARADVIDSLQSTKLFPDRWILKRFTNMTDDEIDQMHNEAKKDENKEKEDGPIDVGGGPPLSDLSSLSPLSGHSPSLSGLSSPGPGGPETPEVALSDLPIETSLEVTPESRKTVKTLNENYNSSFDHYLMANELDGLSSDGIILVGNVLSENDIETAKLEAKTIMTEERKPKKDSSDEPITENDIPK
jgi:hypothetical protein